MFDPKKPVKQRNGNKARIICVDLDNGDGSDFTIVAAVKVPQPDSGIIPEIIEFFSQNGIYCESWGESPYDLING